MYKAVKRSVLAVKGQKAISNIIKESTWSYTSEKVAKMMLTKSGWENENKVERMDHNGQEARYSIYWQVEKSN